MHKIGYELLGTLAIQLPSSWSSAGIRDTHVCGSLHDNGPHRLKTLHAQSPESGTLWKGLGGMALCYWE